MRRTHKLPVKQANSYAALAYLAIFIRLGYILSSIDFVLKETWSDVLTSARSVNSHLSLESVISAEPEVDRE